MWHTDPVSAAVWNVLVNAHIKNDVEFFYS